MSGRYPGWHGKSGDVNASPALRNAGKKLLGYLVEHSRLSGVDTMTRSVELADGSVVTARLVNGTPRVDYEPGGVMASQNGVASMIEGMVVTPRTFASPTAYGANPQVLLNGKSLGSENEEWRGLFYDETYFPTGEGGKSYKRNRFGQEVFFQGFPNEAMARRWTNADDSLCLCWYGAADLLGVGTGQYLFYNGGLLVDGGTGAKIRGACIRGTTLLWVDRNTMYQAELSPLDYTGLRWVKGHTTTRAYPPLLNQINLANAVEVVTLPTPWDGNYTHVAFSRDGLEARTIIRTASNTISSIVYSLADLEDVVTTSNGYTIGLSAATSSFVYTNAPYPFYLAQAPGYTTEGELGVDLTYTFVTMVGMHSIKSDDEVVCDETYDRTIVPSFTARTVPVAVEYLANNTPIYAYLIPASEDTHYTRSASITAEDTASGFINQLTPNGIDVEISAAASHSVASSVTETGTISRVYTGVYVPGWIDLYGSYEATESVSGSSEDFRDESDYVAETDSAPSGELGAVLLSAAGFPETGSCTGTVEGESIDIRKGIWYFDLRTKSIVYSVMTTEDTWSTEVTDDTSPDINTGATALPYVNRHNESGRTRSCTTYVVMNGETVDTATCTAAPTSSSADFNSGRYHAYKLRTSFGTFATFHSAGATFLDDYEAFTDDPNSYLYPQGGFASPSTWSGAATAQTLIDGSHPDGDLDTSSSSTPTAWLPTAPLIGSDILDPMTTGWVNGSVTTPVQNAHRGVWLPYKNAWVFSMPWLSGTAPVTRTWKTAISSGQNVDDITGKNGLELLGTAWPISRCLSGFKTI